jgi:hypothetical protein
MSHLTVVTAAFKSTAKQPAHFLVVDAGLSYVLEGDLLTPKQAAQLIRDCYHVAAEYNSQLVAYNPQSHAKLRLKLLQATAATRAQISAKINQI